MINKYTFLRLLMIGIVTINAFATKASSVKKPLPISNPAIIASISCAQNGDWNDPNTWSPNLVPTINDDVTIGMGLTVTLSGTMNARSIMVMGTLKPTTLSTSFDLTTEGIMVHGGVFTIGTSAQAYVGNAKITLTGNNPTQTLFSGMGTKVIGVMGGGTLEFNGIAKKSWSQLGATAAAGASTITMKENVDWSVNDEIVIATTDFLPSQSEKRKITAITGTSITLDRPLDYMHFGQLQNYANAARNFSLDERAEVGLLTHNIKIVGDENSLLNGFGGHIMSMAGSVANASNIELFQMGQKSKVGRYPWHWHLVGNAGGQFIKNSSIHKSFNRIITVHGTNNTVVEGNVGYDFIGHGYFLENGDETGNLFKNNLGVYCKRPITGEETTPSDRGKGEDGSEDFPVTFWITNPSNDYIGNVAAGSDGSGFWHLALSRPLGSANATMVPGKMPMGIFDDNKSHSANFNWGVGVGIDKTTGTTTPNLYKPELNDTQFIPKINRFTGYKSKDRNIWFFGNTIKLYDCVLADNGRATFFSYNQILYNSIIVGKSANIGMPISANELQAGRTLPYPELGINDGLNVFRGHSIYDGPSGIVDTHFAGFDNIGAKSVCFQTNGASKKSTNHFARGITFDPSIPEVNKVDFTPGSNRSFMFLSGLIDEDGSITGVPNGHITPIIFKDISNGRVYEEGNNIQQDNVIKRPEWGAWITTNKNYNYFKNDDGWGDGASTPRYIITKFPNGSTHATYAIQTQGLYFDNPVITNDLQYNYYVQYHKIPNKIDIVMNGAKTDQEAFLVAYENMPSTAKVISGATLASSFSDLQNATTNKYFRKNNTIWFKLVSNQISDLNAQWRFGEDTKYRTGNVQICQDNNCSNPTGNTEVATFIDYGEGNDDRDNLTTSDNLPISTLTTNVGNANFTVTNNGNGKDGYTDYSFKFSRQVWEAFKTLNIDYTGPKVEVLAKNTQNEFISLGTYASTDIAKINLSNFYDRDVLTKIDGLVLRFKESNMGGSLNTSATTAVQIRSITLGYDTPTAYSTSLSPTSVDSDGDDLADIAEVQNCRNPISAADFSLDFDSNRDSANTWTYDNITNLIVANGKISGISSGNGAYFYKNGNYSFSGSSVTKMRLNMKASQNGPVRIFWKNEDGNNFGSRLSSANYTGNGGWQIIEFNLSANVNWIGKTINTIRIDPTNILNTSFSVDWLRSVDYTECPCAAQKVVQAISTIENWTYYGEPNSTDYLFAIEHNPVGGNTLPFTASITLNKLCDANNDVHKVTDVVNKEGTFIAGYYWNMSLLSGSTNGFVNVRFFPSKNQIFTLDNTASSFYSTSGATYSSPLMYFKTNNLLNLPDDIRSDATGLNYGFSPLKVNSTGSDGYKDYVQFNTVNNVNISGGGVLMRVTNLTQDSPSTTTGISTPPLGALRYNPVLRKFEGFDGIDWRLLH